MIGEFQWFLLDQELCCQLWDHTVVACANAFWHRGKQQQMLYQKERWVNITYLISLRLFAVGKIIDNSHR